MSRHPGTPRHKVGADLLELLERDAESLERRGLLDVRRPRSRPEDTINTLYLQQRRRGDRRPL